MGSLVFFAFVIGIDLLLKSLKDKKKIEDVRQKKMQELNKKPNNKPINQPSREAEKNIRREALIKRNHSFAREEDEFHGEGRSYRDDREGYRDRYKDRYKSIEKNYQADDKRDSLYDPNAIQTSAKKEYKELDIRNYGRSKEKVEIPVPTASTFKNDVLNGIIFSEILGKPKSLQKK